MFSAKNDNIEINIEQVQIFTDKTREDLKLFVYFWIKSIL